MAFCPPPGASKKNHAPLSSSSLPGCVCCAAARRHDRRVCLNSVSRSCLSSGTRSAAQRAAVAEMEPRQKRGGNQGEREGCSVWGDTQGLISLANSATHSCCLTWTERAARRAFGLFFVTRRRKSRRGPAIFQQENAHSLTTAQHTQHSQSQTHGHCTVVPPATLIVACFFCIGQPIPVRDDRSRRAACCAVPGGSLAIPDH